MVSERVSSGHTSSGSDEVTREAVLRARAAIAEHERTVPDFPKPGVVFKDFTPLLRDPHASRAVVHDVVRRRAGSVDVVVGIEARGFILGAAMLRGSDTRTTQQALARLALELRDLPASPEPGA